MCGPLLRRFPLYRSARKTAKLRKSVYLPAALIVVSTVFYTGEVGYTGPRGLRENPGASVNEPLNRAGIRERRYRRSGNPAQGLPTVPASGEKRPFLPRPARERASVGTDGRRIRCGATDAPRFRRSTALVLPTLPDSRAAPPYSNIWSTLTRCRVESVCAFFCVASEQGTLVNR